MFLLIAWVLWRWEPIGLVLDDSKEAICIMNTVVMVNIQNCFAELRLTGLMGFGCSVVNTEKFAMSVPFMSVYGWFRKMLIRTTSLLF